MENIPNQNNSQNPPIVKKWKKYTLYGMISLLFLFGTAYGGYFGYGYYQENYAIINHPSFGTDEAMKWILSKEKESQVTSRYLNNLGVSSFQSINTGDLSYVIKIFNEAILVTHGNSSITGKNFISDSVFSALSSNMEKIRNEKSRKVRSEIYFQNGEIEYEIGNTLYFHNNEEYAIAIVYYYLRAIESFDRSIRESDTAKAHRQKGVVLLDLGEGGIKKAVPELEKAVILDNTDVINYYKLGNAYRRNGQNTQGIDTYLRGLGINPSHELIQVNLAVAYDEDNNTSEAIKVIRKYLKSCREYCNIGYYNLGDWISKTEGWSTGAVSIYESAIESSKKKGETYRNAYRTLGKHYFEKGIISIWYIEKDLLALSEKYLLTSINNPSDKATHINMFNQNTDEAETFYLLGKLYIRKNDSGNAKRYIEMGLKRYPKDENLIMIQKEYQKKYPPKGKMGIS